MRTVPFGDLGVHVSELGVGGAEIGFGNVPQPDVDLLLNSALDAGINVIDTAECYAESEDKIGRAVSHRRDEYFLLTKCGHSRNKGLADWDVRLLEQQIDESLIKLKTDRLDLVQLHSCSLEHLERGEVIEVLEKAKQAGKTRWIGYSGDREEALYAVNSGRFDTLQTSCNLFDQQVLNETIPTALTRGMGVIAKRPIGNAVWKWASLEECPDYPKPYWQRMTELEYPELLGEREPIEVALGFTKFSGVHTMIVGASSSRRITDNVATLRSLHFSASEFESIRQHWLNVAKPDWIGQT